MNSRDKKLAELRNKQKEIEEKGRAVFKKKRDTLDPATKVTLEIQLNNLKEEFNKIQETIQRLENGEPLNLTPEQLVAQLSNDWRKGIHQLDYTQAEESFQKILNEFDTEDAALVLIQQQEEFKADLFLKRIKAVIQNQSVGLQGFSETYSSTDVLSGPELIKRLARTLLGDKLNEMKFSTLDELKGAVIDALFDRVGYGQILYVEIYCSKAEDDFFIWFLENFWELIVQRLTKQKNCKPGTRIITILLTEDTVKADCLPQAIYKSPTDFNPHAYYNIELQPWTEKDVKLWVYHYINSRLREHVVDDDKVNKLLTQISDNAYKFSRGTPALIYNNLLGSVMDLVVKEITNEANEYAIQ